MSTPGLTSQQNAVIRVMIVGITTASHAQVVAPYLQGFEASGAIATAARDATGVTWVAKPAEVTKLLAMSSPVVALNQDAEWRLGVASKRAQTARQCTTRPILVKEVSWTRECPRLSENRSWSTAANRWNLLALSCHKIDGLVIGLEVDTLLAASGFRNFAN